MTKKIYFDMDGTIADLYAVDGWLPDLRAHIARPYAEAKVMHNMALLARLLNKAQRNGYRIGIISWLAKDSTAQYDQEVAEIKRKWLKKHLNSVTFDEIHIVAYGTPKSTLANGGILFDDEERNRLEWQGNAYAPEKIFEILKEIC